MENVASNALIFNLITNPNYNLIFKIYIAREYILYTDGIHIFPPVSLLFELSGVNLAGVSLRWMVSDFYFFNASDICIPSLLQEKCTSLLTNVISLWFTCY